MDPNTILSRLRGVRRMGDGRWMAFCPVHEQGQGHEPSLSVTVAEGRILLHCHGGCSPEAIISSVGLRMTDLFAEPPAKSQPEGVRLADLARKTGLPEGALRAFGLQETLYGETPAVLIPYYHQDGSPGPRRYRLSLTGDKRFVWGRGSKAIPYCRPGCTATEMILLEGESDCWTLWHEGISAIGIPGASLAKSLEASHLDGVESLWIVREADRAGGEFVLQLADRLKALGSLALVRVIDMRTTGAAKDPNELFHQDTQAFREVWATLMRQAPTLSDYMAQQVAAPAPKTALPDLDTMPLSISRDRPRATLLNACILVHRELKDRLRYNLFSGRVEVNDGGWRDWTDADDIHLSVQLAAIHQMDASPRLMLDAVLHVARRTPIHPVRDHLSALKWDGKARVGTWLTDYMGVEPSLYSQAVGACWLISAVARAFEPACKAELALILEGTQGIGKSTTFRILAGNDKWFSDDLEGIGGKTAAESLQGKWIVELSELDGLTKAEVQTVRAFISRQYDRYRAPYGRTAEDHPRQCVLAGTTNSAAYLQDSTGNRRFAPVLCRAIELEQLKADRDQLWAEAVVLYRSGVQYHLTAEEAAAQAEETEARRVRDEWEDLIATHINHRPRTTVGEILTEVLGISKSDWKQSEQNRVARVLQKLGWARKRVRYGNELRWEYMPPNRSPGDNYCDDELSVSTGFVTSPWN